MSVLDGIAYYQSRPDEVPNQQLAAESVKTRDTTCIGQIAKNLLDENPNAQSDWLKVLYEIGHKDLWLVSDYVADFLKLLSSRNNRLVWGAMIGISTIAGLKAAEIGLHVDDIMRIMEKGSAITVDSAVKTLATIGSLERKLKKRVVTFLFDHLRSCRAKDVPQHSEKVIVAIDSENRTEFVRILSSRMKEPNASQAKRVTKVEGFAAWVYRRWLWCSRLRAAQVCVVKLYRRFRCT